MRTIAPDDIRPGEIYRLMIGAILPRPIALVSTVSPDGVLNCAPFSYFMGVSSVPPILALSVGSRRDGTPKDTACNVRDTHELVVNVVDEDIVRACVETAADVAPEVDEFVHAGLHPQPSDLVAPPRVREAALQMECRLERYLEIGAAPQYLILAEILCFHVAERVWKDGAIDVAALRPVGRLGGSLYAPVRDLFEIERP